MSFNVSPAVPAGPVAPSTNTVAASTSSVNLFGANRSARIYSRSVVNNSAATLFLRFGAAASLTAYTVVVPPGGAFDFPAPVYTGDVFAVWSSATGSAICSENDLLGAAARLGFAPMPAGGQYTFTASPGASSSSNSMGVGTLRLAPWLVTRPCVIDRIGSEIATIGDAGSLLRLGVYADNGNSYPGALLLDAGTIAGDSATVQQVTCSLALTPGLYWVGGAVQSVTTTQPTVRGLFSSFASPVPIVLAAAPSAGGTTTHGYTQTGVTGALPATFTSTVTTLGGGVCPRVHVRVA
jgi:hypothetical protein